MIALLVALVLAFAPAADQTAAKELQTGIALTRSGHFQEAIPQLLAARGRVAQTFALEFNLALCYVGTHQYALAVQTLTNIHGNNAEAAQVENLLAQAYIGNHRPERAVGALKNAAAITPKNEKLYVFVSDACLDEGYYDLGIEIASMGLQNLPESSRLLYQRGLLESRLEEIDLANRDFELVRRISPDSDLGYIAATQEALFMGKIPEAVQLAREAIRKGHDHYMLLAMLGEALLRSGATPGTADWNEAHSALEKAVSERPGYSSAQVAIGKLYFLENRLPEAIAHLESGRELDPHNPAVYPSLAAAYQRAGNPGKARAALLALATLNKEQAARIASAAGGHAGIADTPR